MACAGIEQREGTLEAARGADLRQESWHVVELLDRAGIRFDRLDAETVRDAMLRASGLLSSKIGGPSVYPPQPASVAALAYGNTAWPTSRGEDRFRRAKLDHRAEVKHRDPIAHGLHHGQIVTDEQIGQIELPLQIGQQVQAVIKGLDWENDRINLSIKETLEDPWDAAVKNLSEGKAYVGVIARLAQFGAFVTLAPGVDGLVHISKLGGGRRINHPKEVVEAGQNLEVVIEAIDTASRRISLVPSDYVSVEDEEEKERREFQDYRASSKKGTRDDGVGSFGALLKAKLEGKK
mgnify:CR=1 FL=1